MTGATDWVTGVSAWVTGVRVWVTAPMIGRDRLGDRGQRLSHRR